jgi:hypothetical protein
VAGALSLARVEVPPLVALLFAGSGCFALICEIVWYRLH